MDLALLATPAWVLSLPEPLSSALAWLLSPAVLGGLGVASVLMLAASVFGLPWLLARLPADHFRRPSDETEGGGDDVSEGERAPLRRSPTQLATAVTRNVVGVLLLLAGLAMLVLPGQGLLTLVVALLLLDFPGKMALERRLIANDRVFRGLNAVRRRMHVAPFVR